MYNNKYLKYKNKYLELKKGGSIDNTNELKTQHTNLNNSKCFMCNEYSNTSICNNCNNKH